VRYPGRLEIGVGVSSRFFFSAYRSINVVKGFLDLFKNESVVLMISIQVFRLLFKARGAQFTVTLTLRRMIGFSRINFCNLRVTAVVYRRIIGRKR